MEHPKDIGDRSTLAIMLALREAGYALYVPFGENTRCDLLIEDGDSAALLVEAPRNGQRQLIRFASDYELRTACR